MDMPRPYRQSLLSWWTIGRTAEPSAISTRSQRSDSVSAGDA